MKLDADGVNEHGCAMSETCRNWIEDKTDRCNAPAVAIVWGKLFDKDALGPRCENCLYDQLGHRGLTDPSYAIYHLPDPTQDLKDPKGGMDAAIELLAEAAYHSYLGGGHPSLDRLPLWSGQSESVRDHWRGNMRDDYSDALAKILASPPAQPDRDLKDKLLGEDLRWVAAEALYMLEWVLKPGIAQDPAASHIAQHKLRDLRDRLAALEAALAKATGAASTSDPASECETWVNCEVCERRIPAECAATGIEGEAFCGACLAGLDAPILKAAWEVTHGKPGRLRDNLRTLHLLLEEGHSDCTSHLPVGEAGGEEAAEIISTGRLSFSYSEDRGDDNCSCCGGKPHCHGAGIHLDAYKQPGMGGLSEMVTAFCYPLRHKGMEDRRVEVAIRLLPASSEPPTESSSSGDQQ